MSVFQKFLESDTGNRLLGFAVEHRQRFFITLICAFMIYVFLCLFSYNPADPAWSHLPNGESTTVTNIGGMGGAWLADVLYLFFGKMAWLVLLWLAMEAYYVLIPDRYMFPLRFVSYGLLWVCVCIFGVVLAQITQADPALMAGVIGQSSFRALSLLLTNIGAYLFAFVCFFGLGYLMVSPLYQGRGYFSDFLTKNTKKTPKKSPKPNPAPAPSSSLIKDSVLPNELSEPESPNHNFDGVLNNFLINSGIQDELHNKLDDNDSSSTEPKDGFSSVSSTVQPPQPVQPIPNRAVLVDTKPTNEVLPKSKPILQPAPAPAPMAQQPKIHTDNNLPPPSVTQVPAPTVAQKETQPEQPKPIVQSPPTDPDTITPQTDHSAQSKLVYEYETAPPTQSYQQQFDKTPPNKAKPSTPSTPNNTIFEGIRLEKIVAHSNVPHPPARLNSLNLGSYVDKVKRAAIQVAPNPIVASQPQPTPPPSVDFDSAPKPIPVSEPTPVVEPTTPAPAVELELVRDEPALAPTEQSPVELSLVQDNEIQPATPKAESNPSFQTITAQPSSEPVAETISTNQPAPNRHDKTFNNQSFAIKSAKHQANLSKLPPLSLLDERPIHADGYSETELVQLAELLEIKLKEFGVNAEVMGISQGPVITSFEVALAAGIKASKVTGIAQDLARSLSVATVRVVEVIVGKPYIGIEIPNKTRQTIRLIELLDTPEYQNSKGFITAAIGKSSIGEIVMTDIYTAPHMLIAGATRSGKSVLVNSMLLSMLLKYTPEELRFVMIDPKLLELTIYDDIPHLLTPVITDMNDSMTALSWCVGEMNRRYHIMNSIKVRQISDYNKKVQEAINQGEPLIDKTWQPTDSVSDTPPTLKPMPYIVVVVDEYADLVSQVKQVEELIDALARKSRAAGIHIILATQRPSVDVITGVIKANIPARIALSVRQKVDSRTILDTAGAETLLGYGDMLFIGNNSNDPIRVHGSYVTEKEVDRVCAAWRERGVPDYVEMQSASRDFADSTQNEGQDELYGTAVAYVLNSGKTSISALQREIGVGYNRAAKLIDAMEANGILSAPDHTNKRTILKN